MLEDANYYFPTLACVMILLGPPRIAQRFAKDSTHAPPDEVVWIFGVMGIAMASIGLLFTLLKLQAARALRRRDSRMLILIAAAVTCLEFPYGTALGVMTFVVMNRQSVEHLFEDPEGPPRAGY